MGRKKSKGTIDNKVKVKKEIPSVHTEGLPYYSDIRMSWKANKKHCEANDKRGYYEKGITFCEEWKGELGWLRYYLYHIDNGYVKGKSKLERIDQTKGFSPTNCRIADKEVKKKKSTTSKHKTIGEKQIAETTKESNKNAPSIVNNFIIASNDVNPQEIIELVMNRGNHSIDDKSNIIYLNTENQLESHIKRKN